MENQPINSTISEVKEQKKKMLRNYIFALIALFLVFSIFMNKGEVTMPFQEAEINYLTVIPAQGGVVNLTDEEKTEIIGKITEMKLYRQIKNNTKPYTYRLLFNETNGAFHEIMIGDGLIIMPDGYYKTSYSYTDSILKILNQEGK